MSNKTEQFKKELKEFKASKLGQTKISLFPNVRDIQNSEHIPLWYVFASVKGNKKTKQLIDGIRKYPNDKDQRNNLKSNLKCFVPGGTFKERNKNGLIEHSGIMVVDFDGYDGDPKKSDDFKRLKECPETVLVFMSPSGKGFKGFVRIPKCSAKEHTKYFKAFQIQHEFDKWDKSTSDVSRICYESYDIDAYLNINATVFSPDLDEVDIKVEEIKKIEAERNGLTYELKADHNYSPTIFALSDEDKIIELVMKFKNPYSFVKGEIHNYTHHLARVMQSKGVTEITCAEYINQNINTGEATKEYILKTVANTYSHNYFPYEPFEDYEKKKRVKEALRKDRRAVLESGEFDVDQEVLCKLESEIEKEFWYRDEKDQVKIIIRKYIDFLSRNGFGRYYPDNKGGEGEKSKYIRIQNNQVSMSSTQEIRDFVIKYLDENNLYDVREIVSKYYNLFHDNVLLQLKPLIINPLRDTEKVSYLPTPNGILKMTPEGKEFINYEDTNAMVWKHLIKGKKFSILENDDNDYRQFINYISGGQPLPFETAIGYLCHQFKTDYENKAILLFDSTVEENPNGGAGKGLFYKGVKNMRNAAYIDGKRIDEKSNYQNQTVEETDNIVFLDDVIKGFNLELYFPFLTEGITIRKLYSQPIYVPHERSPKLLISSNYWIKGTGNSHKRRRFELEFNDHYGEHRQPLDDFGHSLFSGWDDEHWNRFYNYMSNCIIKYLRYGLVEQTNAKMKNQRKILAETSGDFLDWMENDENFPTSIRLNKKDYYNNFKNSYSKYNWLTSKRFTQWVQLYADFKGFDFDCGKSNNQRWFSITEPKIINSKGKEKVLNLMDTIKKEDAQKLNSDKDDIFNAIFEAS